MRNIYILYYFEMGVFLVLTYINSSFDNFLFESFYLFVLRDRERELAIYIYIFE